MSLIRAAVPSDIPEILGMIHDLAAYEKEPGAVKTTEEMLDASLFGPDPKVFAHVVHNGSGVGPAVLGYAVWYLSYSTWEGTHGIYLEDLYVRPATRGAGYGKALLRTLAQIAVERGYARVEWSVLDWNTPAIDFYASLGAAALDGWHVRRLDGEALAAAAGTAASGGSAQ